ncbi:hypothetical protein GLOTRDRAFT_19679, partial [Gloeophyllum trabeum ATCC 11539]
TLNTSTGYTPFQLRHGCSPRVIPPLDPGSAPSSETVDAHSLIQRLDNDVAEARDNLFVSKIDQAYFANKHRGHEHIYSPGDYVLLSTKNRRQDYKRKGEFRVAK